MRQILRILFFALLLLIGILLVNTFRLTSHQLTGIAPAAPIAVPDSAIYRLAGVMRIPTVSFTDYSLTDTTQFDKFLVYIRHAFPLVHSRLRQEKFNQYGLVYTWKGQNPALKPVLLMAHYDVVPVIQGTQRMWKRPPFAGVIVGDSLYGRGTLDDKASVMALLETTELLLKSGFQPTRTLMLSFGQDEEASGYRGAQSIVKALQQRHIEPEYILDEGGVIKTDGVAGLKKSIALIGISEKGFMSLELTAIGKGGHSSMPPPQTSIGLVAEAVAKLEKHPFPTRLDGGMDHLLDYLASEVPFGQRLVFANQWLFAPLIKQTIGKTNSGLAALHTTIAPTIFKAGAKDNVLAIEAVATVNFRILPGDSVAGVIQRVNEIIDNPEVKVTVLGHGNNPPPISDPESSQFGLLHRTIRSVFPDVVVAPYVVLGATDARFFAPVCQRVYRFTPMPLTDAESQGMHGTNERISVRVYQNMIRFYVTLIRNSQQPMN